VKDKVHIKAYPTAERAGVIWAYMGKRAAPPAFPDLPIFRTPLSQVSVWCMQRECNYLQALEGDLDTSHAGFLHTGMAPPDLPADTLRNSPEVLGILNKTPEFKVIVTPYGVMAGAHRPAQDGQTYWRFTQFMLPFYSQVPPCPLGSEALLRAWVPMDDTHTMYFSITTDTFSISRSPRATKRPVPQPGLSYDYEFLPNTSDWYGRCALRRTARTIISSTATCSARKAIPVSKASTFRTRRSRRALATSPITAARCWWQATCWSRARGVGC
jgi:phthalate 4,5-dioxygenase